MVRTLVYAYVQGFRDGFESPSELGSGLTWEDNDTANEVYDTGANHGQIVGGLLKGIRPQPWDMD